MRRLDAVCAGDRAHGNNAGIIGIWRNIRRHEANLGWIGSRHGQNLSRSLRRGTSKPAAAEVLPVSTLYLSILAHRVKHVLTGRIDRAEFPGTIRPETPFEGQAALCNG